MSASSSSSPSSSSALVLSCLLAPACAFGADASGTDELERIVVSANRIEQPLSRIGDSVTLIDPEQVRASQKLTVSDLLAATPGITVTRNGGLGGSTQLRIRGAESDQTVVLIDGVKLNDPSSAGGGFNFANLLTGDYMRIEVLRGPQSTLWGSQAIGGVVNIVTTVPEGPLLAEYSAEGGARGSATVQARAEAGNERFSWRVAGKYLTTDGVSAFNEERGGHERDGYRNTGANVRGLYRINEAVSAELRATYSRGRVDFDGFSPTFALTDTREYGDTEELVAYTGVNATTFGGKLQNRIGFAYTDTDRQNIDPDSPVPTTFDATGRNERWEYQGTLTLNDIVGGVFGLESEHSELNTRSPSVFDPNPVPLAHDARLDSVYAQLSISPIESLTLTAGMRYDDHDTFGNESTGRATVAWAATPTTIVRASYGEGFKAPTLFQLFSEFGNEALDPERADAWDAGIEQHLLNDALMLSATYFVRNTRNMIDFVSCFASTDPLCAARPFGYYDNVQKTEADGFELGLVARLGERLRFDANYTDMETTNRGAGANFGRELPRRPGQTLNGELSYQWPVRLTTTVAVTHAGRSFDNASNTIVVDAYTVVDLRAAFALRDDLELYGRLENALDEEYETIAGYGTPGRGVFVGVRQSF